MSIVIVLVNSNIKEKMFFRTLGKFLWWLRKEKKKKERTGFHRFAYLNGKLSKSGKIDSLTKVVSNKKKLNKS